MAKIEHEKATSDRRTRPRESRESRVESVQMNMKNQKEKLVEMIESEFGLLDKLMKLGAMTHNKCEQIRSKSTRHKMNEMILKHVLQQNKHQELIEALMESSQTHVVNWIRSNGVHRAEFGLEWPLTERVIELLDVNQEELVDLLDTSELLSKLFSQKVINVRQREFVDSMQFSHRRNEVLLGIIRRLSRKSYFTVITCLKESNQPHVAGILERIRILENGGVIVRVRVSLKCDDLKFLNEAKKQIAEEMTYLLTNQDISKVEAKRLLSAVRLQIVGVKYGDDLILYVCCSKEDEFRQLCEDSDYFEPKNILEQLFNALLRGPRIEVLEMRVLAKDLSKAKQSFQVLASRKERLEANVSNTTLKKSQERKLQENKSTVSAKAKEKRKVVLVGEAYCGKTCLALVITRNQFPTMFNDTIGMACEVTEVDIDTDGQRVELQIWDTSGQKAYAAFRPLYYRQAHVFILCFALDCRQSLEVIPSEWVPQVREVCPNAALILVGNKKDLLQDAVTRNELKDLGLNPVTPEEGQAMAHKIGAVAYLECSALLGEGVREVKEMAARVVIPADVPITRKEKRSKRKHKRCTIS